MTHLIYDIFAFIAAAVGCYSGYFFLAGAWKHRRNKFMLINLFLLALANLWIAGVYLLSIKDTVTTSLTLGVFLRPAIVLLLLIPAAIIKKLGV